MCVTTRALLNEICLTLSKAFVTIRYIILLYKKIVRYILMFNKILCPMSDIPRGFDSQIHKALEEVLTLLG